MSGPAAVSETSRLAWQCRRGMLELDYLLRGFLDNEYAGLTDERKRDFIRLLEQPDPLLYDWFTGNSVPAEPATRRLVSEILESAAGRGREGPA